MSDLREALENASGFLDTPVGRRKFGSDPFYTDVVASIRTALSAPQPEAVEAVAFQPRVHPWMLACFGAEISADRIERNHRFLEEALELVQSTGCTQCEAHQLVDYVYSRPVGETHQEIGGVMVTLAALCLALGYDMHKAGETELARIWTKVEKIRAKQAAKPKHLPLPQAVASPRASDTERMRRALEEIEGLCRHLRHGGPDPMDLQELSDAIEYATQLATEALSSEANVGKTYRVEYDGFVGTMQGDYVTREGKSGVVLQQVGTKVVHVYGENRIVPVVNEGNESEGGKTHVPTLEDQTCTKCSGTGFSEYNMDKCSQCLGEGSYETVVMAKSVHPSDPTPPDDERSLAFGAILKNEAARLRKRADDLDPPTPAEQREARAALNPLSYLFELIDDLGDSPDDTVFFQHDGAVITFGEIRAARAVTGED